MEIKEYVLAKINNETLEKLLLIDNKVHNTNITVNDVISSIKNAKVMNEIGVRFSIVCDGNLDNMINLVMNYYNNINYIYLNGYNLGIMMYLIDIINEGFKSSIYIEEKSLDISYLSSNVILSGSKEFIDKYKLLLKSKNILIY